MVRAFPGATTSRRWTNMKTVRLGAIKAASEAVHYGHGGSGWSPACRRRRRSRLTSGSVRRLALAPSKGCHHHQCVSSSWPRSHRVLRGQKYLSFKRTAQTWWGGGVAIPDAARNAAGEAEEGRTLTEFPIKATGD